MNVLLDTNIFIAVEPTAESNVEDSTEEAVRLISFANRRAITLFIHPAQEEDLRNDRDVRRRDFRRILSSKYALLDPPPPHSVSLKRIIGTAEPGSHDFVDNKLLESVAAHAVAYLVTEDLGIHRKARRAGLADRVLSLSQAIELFSPLFDKNVAPPPAVEHRKAY